MVGMRADVTLNVNTSKAKRSMDRAAAELNKSINGISKKQISFNVNGKSFTQPLGRITASANEFTKSLEASNARVIAFGASVGIINGISEAFKALVVETVKFEKVLQDINVIVGASAGKLQEFGDGLFDVARNTAQAFTVSAEAALEFSRQGLTMEETLRRTNDALVLTRLTGLDAASAVSGLTAAVNAFGDAGLSTTDIIDKLAAVDVKFAVSSEDLIKALERTGAVAIDAGVEIDSLIGLVAALQQTTARGGAVIGNGLKTIFTRIQRPESIRQLEEIGIAVKNLSGSILPADKIMVNMAKSFDNLSQSQQSNIVQFSAGIFQANVFRAALRDLGKEQSIQAQATEIAGNAAGDAARKNEMLNKTMSAMASQTTTSIQELAEILGKIGLAPDIDFFLSSIKDGIDGIKNTLGGGEDEGSTFAKGLVKGIGNVITGPAAIAFGAIFIKLFVNIAKFARTSLKDVLGIANEKDKIRAMEESILKALGENLKLQEGLSNLEDDRKAQEMFILGIIEKQNSAMSEQVSLAARLAKPLVKAGINPDFSKNEASGMIPVAASGIIPESSKKKERQGAAKGGYTAGAIDSMNVKGVGTVVYNKAEKVKQFPGMSQPAIMPPEESKAGRGYKNTFAKKHGFDPYASNGMVPNFARMDGSRLVLDKSLTRLSANPGNAKTTDEMKQSYIDLVANGRPVNVEATMSQLVNNSGRGHSEKVKEVLKFLQEQAGVTSVSRQFDLQKLPFRGRKSDVEAEKAVLKKEGKPFFSTGGRSGDPTFPVDLIGLGMRPVEVKSGEWKLPNVLMKSMRLYSDDGLMSFAQEHFGIDEEMINEARHEKFKKGSKLLMKKGLLAKDSTHDEAHQSLLDYRLSAGFVPNFGRAPGSSSKNYEEAWEKTINTTYDEVSQSNQGHVTVAALNEYVRQKLKFDPQLEKATSGTNKESWINALSNIGTGYLGRKKYSKDTAEDMMQDLSEHIARFKSKDFARQAGLDFEAQFRDHFNVPPNKTAEPHMDFQEGSLEHLGGSPLAELAGLDTFTGGDAYRGATGHPEAQFIAKYLRETLASPEGSRTYDFSNGQGKKLKEMAESKPGFFSKLVGPVGTVKFNNMGKFNDIIGYSGGSDKAVKATETLDRVLAYAPGIKSSLNMAEGAGERKISFSYMKDYVDPTLPSTMHGGLVPNYAKKYSHSESFEGEYGHLAEMGSPLAKWALKTVKDKEFKMIGNGMESWAIGNEEVVYKLPRPQIGSFSKSGDLELKAWRNQMKKMVEPKVEYKVSPESKAWNFVPDSNIAIRAEKIKSHLNSKGIDSLFLPNTEVLKVAGQDEFITSQERVKGDTLFNFQDEVLKADHAEGKFNLNGYKIVDHLMEKISQSTIIGDVHSNNFIAETSKKKQLLSKVDQFAPVNSNRSKPLSNLNLRGLPDDSIAAIDFSSGLIPNFKKLYQSYTGEGNSGKFVSTKGPGFYFDSQRGVDDAIERRRSVLSSITNSDNAEPDFSREYSISDSNLNEMLSGVYSSGNLRKLRVMSRAFAANNELPDQNDEEWEEDLVNNRGNEFDEAYYEMEARLGAHSRLLKTRKQNMSWIGGPAGTKANPQPLASYGSGGYLIPTLASSEIWEDGFTNKDDDRIRSIFSPNLNKNDYLVERKITDEYLGNQDFAEDLSRNAKNPEKAINAARQRGMKAIGDHMGNRGIVPNFADSRTRQQKIQDTLADPSNKGIKFNKLKPAANITSAQISRQLDIPMGKTPEYQPSDEEIKNAINVVAQTRERLQLPGYENLKSIDKAKILKKYKEHCEDGEHYGNKDLTAARGLIPNFANVHLYRGQKNKSLDAPDISESLPSFASAQTPDDVVTIVQDFVKRHVSGDLSGYRNKQGVAGEKKASGANSFSTSPHVADNFANSIDLTTNDMSQGQVFKKTVPSKNIFNKAKLLKILNKGSDPKSGSYPSVEKFKKEIESGAIKNWAQKNGGMYLNISGVNNDPSSGKGYGQSMEQIVPPADVGYNEDRTRQIHQGEREVIQLFNNGLVPNFSKVERVQKSQKRRVKEQITEGDKDLAHNIFDYLKTNISNLSSKFRFNRSTVSFGGNPEDYEKVFNHSSSRKNRENLIEIARSEMKMNRILKGFMIPHNEGVATARGKYKAPRDPFLGGAVHGGLVPNFVDLYKPYRANGGKSIGMENYFYGSNNQADALSYIKSSKRLTARRAGGSELRKFSFPPRVWEMLTSSSPQNIEPEMNVLPIGTRTPIGAAEAYRDTDLGRGMSEQEDYASIALKNAYGIRPPFFEKIDSWRNGETYSTLMTNSPQFREMFNLDRLSGENVVPNFAANSANPLADAISREKAAGIPQARIRIERSSQLKSPQNPMGLAVTNTRDEPAGVQQGIRRAKTMGIDPKKHGSTKGMFPNFAAPQIPSAILNNAKNELSEMSKAFTDSFGEFSKIASQFGKEGKETLAEISSFDISEDFAGIKDLLTEKLQRTEQAIDSITSTKGKISKRDQARLDKLKGVKSSGESLLKSTEDKSQKSKVVKGLLSGKPEAQKAQMIKLEAEMIKKMLTARGQDLESLKESTKASQDFRIALDESAKAAEESEDDGGGLQRLFFLQSAISLVNGQFEMLAEGASGLTKNFAEGMLAISNVTASFIQQKELVSEGMSMAGVKKDDSFSIGQAFNPEARAARRSAAAASDAQSRGSGVGRMGGLMRNLSGVGRMFGRFLPVIGQLYTGFTFVNEAFKMFNIGEMFDLEKGSGVMDLLSTQGERAAKKLEKLGESTEKLQGALESLNSQTENREKITDLEILGSMRTQKQELELDQLKLKGLDIDIKAQDALSGLLDENLVGTKVSKRFIEELSKGTNSNEDYVKVMERVIKAQKNQAAFLTGSKNFGDLIDKKLDKFNPGEDDVKLLQSAAKVRGSQIGMGLSSVAAGGEDMDVKDRLSILKKNIAALEKESSTASFDSMGDVTNLTNRLAKNLQGTEDFDAGMMASQINSYIKNIDESIDNRSGLDPRETEAVNAGMKQIVIQLNKLKKNLEGESERHEEAQLKKEYVTAYKNIIFNIEQFRKNENHLTKLSLASLDHQNKLNSSQQSLLLEYGAIGKEAAISSDFARKRNAMEAKFIADKQGIEMKSIESLNKLRDTYFNTDILAQKFKKDGEGAVEAVQALKDNIKKGLTDADFSGIKDMGFDIDQSVMEEVSAAFKGVAKKTKKSESSLEVITGILAEYGKSMDGATATAYLLALHQKKLLIMTDEDLNLAKDNQLSRRRQLEILSKANERSKEALMLEEEYKFIKEKTVAGAVKLFNILKLREPAEQITLEAVRGEAATLAVINNYRNNEASVLAKSVDVMELGLQKQVEKNRIDAVSAVNSLRMLEAQTGSLKDSENSLIILEAKLKSETENAKLALRESEFRFEYLSDQSKRSELVRLQLAKEMSDLKTSNLLAEEKNVQLSSGKKLSELVGEQLKAALHSSRLEALTAAENALLLTGKTKQVKLIQEANELQEASNKLTELQNAVTKAGVSDRSLRIMTTADIGIEKANSILGTRTAGMRASVDPSPENMLAYANSLEQSNKLHGIGSRSLDRLRSKMAELNVSAENLGADLVDIGIDNARSGLKQMFKDIGVGAKTAREAFTDFGLSLADSLLDRMMDHNIDQIIKNLTYAFTGEDGTSSDSKMKIDMSGFGQALDRLDNPITTLASEIGKLSQALRDQILKEKKVNSPHGDKVLNSAGVAPKGFNVKSFASIAPVTKKETDNAARRLQEQQKPIIQSNIDSAKANQAHENMEVGNIGLATLRKRENLKKKEDDYKARLAGQRDDSYVPGFGDIFSDRNAQNIVADKSTVHREDMSVEYSSKNYNELWGQMTGKRLQEGYGLAYDGPNNPTPPGHGPLGYAKDFFSPESSRLGVGSRNTLQARANQSSATYDQRNAIASNATELENLREINRGLEYARDSCPVATTTLEEVGDELRKAATAALNLKTVDLDVNTVIEKIDTKMRQLSDALIKSANQLEMNTLPTLESKGMKSKFSGGKIQHFAKGGFVDGPAGVDKVPAMLTAGEFVIPKGQAEKLRRSPEGINKFKEGGRAESGFKAIAQGVTMVAVSQAVARAMSNKDDASPPEFDKNKFKNLDLRSDVNIKRGDPRLTGRALARDPVMQEYKDHLLEKSAYEASKINEKFEKKMGFLESIVGVVSSYGLSKMTEIASPYIKKSVDWVKNKTENVVKGNSLSAKFNYNAKAYRSARDRNWNVDYSDVKESIRTGTPIDVSGESYEAVSSLRGGGRGNITRNNYQVEWVRQGKDKAKKEGKPFQSGGSVPAMLTAGEGFIPSAIAKRIGYDSLNKMNNTGGLPIIQGKGGIDNVGPVGLTEGDFIIKKSSTDKLLRENPAMMKFALQNPDGFRKGEQGYYEGGVVGSPTMIDQPSLSLSNNKHNGVKPANPSRASGEATIARANPTQAPQAKSEVSNNITVNVTIDQTGAESVSTSGEEANYSQEQELSMKIKTKVLEVIRQEKRIGGELG